MRTLDARDMDHATMIAHSFSGGVQLGFAARWPARIVELVFADTLAASRRWPLAREATRHPFRLLRMATPRAAGAFSWSLLAYPQAFAQAAWWGFTSGRSSDIKQVASYRLPTHVVWANRDSLLSRDVGRAFAEELGGSFDIARAPDERWVEHGWIYRYPDLFVRQLEDLGLKALRPTADGAEPRAPGVSSSTQINTV